MTPSLAVVIVSFQCRDVLRNCLTSLRQTGLPLRVVVVDNASTDGSAAMVSTEFPQATVIANDENRGFAAACNQGIAATTEPLVLLLNPDTTIDAPGLGPLIQVMEQEPRVGACGPRILNPDGSLQPSCRRFPTLGRLLFDEFGLAKLWPRSRVFAAYRMTWWSHDTRREVDQLMGAALLLRRTALDEVGLLDERFFVYYEEVDLCLRLHQHGWSVVFVPEAAVTHQAGHSARQVLGPATLYRYRSLFAFYRKHYPGWHPPLLKLAVATAAVVRVVAYTLPPTRHAGKRAAFTTFLRALPGL
ncbi:glycosyltransferase family 2 protein [bacterium]|nr:glycosyltransferase family 2 protein [bacterium]